MQKKKNSVFLTVKSWYSFVRSVLLLTAPIQKKETDSRGAVRDGGDWPLHVAECLVEAPFRVVGASSAAATAAAHRREWRWWATDQELLFAGSCCLAPDSALHALAYHSPKYPHLYVPERPRTKQLRATYLGAQPVAIAACLVRQRSRKSGQQVAGAVQRSQTRAPRTVRRSFGAADRPATPTQPYPQCGSPKSVNSTGRGDG